MTKTDYTLLNPQKIRKHFFLFLHFSNNIIDKQAQHSYKVKDSYT